MKQQRSMVNGFLIISVVSFVCTIVLTILQVKNPTNTLIVVINNIVICVLTGGIVAFAQSIMAYKSEKYRQLLTFYKDAVIFDEAVIHYAGTTHGFMTVDIATEKVNAVITLFETTVKYSYMCLRIDVNDKEINAAQALYLSFQQEVGVFRGLEDALYEGHAFAHEMEVDKKVGVRELEKENKKVNDKIQVAANKVVDQYNDEEQLNRRSALFKIIEAYLFGVK